MPLTSKGNEILQNMQKQYGDKKGEQVFYASKNAGTISGVESAELKKFRRTRESLMRKFANKLKKQNGG